MCFVKMIVINGFLTIRIANILLNFIKVKKRYVANKDLIEFKVKLGGTRAVSSIVNSSCNQDPTPLCHRRNVDNLWKCWACHERTIEDQFNGKTNGFIDDKYINHFKKILTKSPITEYFVNICAFLRKYTACQLCGSRETMAAHGKYHWNVKVQNWWGLTRSPIPKCCLNWKVKTELFCHPMYAFIYRYIR